MNRVPLFIQAHLNSNEKALRMLIFNILVQENVRIPYCSTALDIKCILYILILIDIIFYTRIL